MKNRREFLATVGTVAATSFAGCSTGQDSSRTDTATTTEKNRPGEASINADRKTVKLPTDWHGEDPSKYNVNVQLQAQDPDGVKSVRLVKDGEAIKEYDNWKEKAEVPVKPDQLKPGENTLTLEEGYGTEEAVGKLW